MKRFMIIALILLTTVSCGRFNRWMQGFTGDAQEVCHEGVTYLQFVSGASVAYTQDGRIKQCKE